MKLGDLITDAWFEELKTVAPKEYAELGLKGARVGRSGHAIVIQVGGGTVTSKKGTAIEIKSVEQEYYIDGREMTPRGDTTVVFADGKKITRPGALEADIPIWETTTHTFLYAIDDYERA